MGRRGVKGGMRDFKETKEGKIGHPQHEWRVRLERVHNRGACTSRGEENQRRDEGL